MAKEEAKIPLGLKIIVGLLALSLLLAIKDYQTYFDRGYLLGFMVGKPWSIVFNLTGVILGEIIPIMSVFNRKLLYWKLSLWYMVYGVISMGMVFGKELVMPSEARVFLLVVFALTFLFGVWVTWYYYSKKSYFNKN